MEIKRGYEKIRIAIEFVTGTNSLTITREIAWLHVEWSPANENGLK